LNQSIDNSKDSEIPDPIQPVASGSLAGKMKAVLFHPKIFFETLSSDEKPGVSLSLAIIAGTIGVAGLIFWQGLFDWLFSAEGLSESLGPWVFMGILLIVGFFFPLVVILYQTFLSIVLHLSLRIFGAPVGRYRRTFTVMAYSQVSFVLGIIPVVGFNIGMIWSMIILVKGIKVTHHLSTAKTLLALFLPLLVLLIPLGFIGVSLIPEIFEDP
jgi:hypothetical protein